MNESWNSMTFNTANMGMLNNRPKDEVSASDINSLLRGRSFGNKQTDETPFTVQDYDENDMKELQEYCAKKGILGVNFGNRNPKTVLQMLKARMGERNESVVKKGLLNG